MEKYSPFIKSSLGSLLHGKCNQNICVQTNKEAIKIIFDFVINQVIQLLIIYK
jgi:hypothetical protein